jgi:hypothetical protein
MIENAIRDYALARGFHRRTLERWLGWRAVDRDALAEIALGLKVSENHLREMIDWLEEISLRDGRKIDEMIADQELVSIRTDPRLGRADKLKRIKERLRRWRFPRLAAVEDAIRQNIQALKLPAEVRLSVAPGLEGGRLQAEISAADPAQLELLARKLGEAAATSSVANIFEHLRGEHAGKEPQRD